MKKLKSRLFRKSGRKLASSVIITVAILLILIVIGPVATGANGGLPILTLIDPPWCGYGYGYGYGYYLVNGFGYGYGYGYGYGTLCPVGGGGGAGAPAVADTTPPSFTPGCNGLGLVSSVGSSSATICFSTDELTRSNLEYGASPGTIIPISTTLTTTHSITLTDLVPDTTYHFRIILTDAAGNVTTSDESTFDTLEATPTPAVTPTPTLTPTPTPPVEGPATPWYWIVVGVAGVAVIGGVVWYVWIRPKP